MKKVAIIGTVGLPAKYGGFETFVSQLVLHLSTKYRFIVFCSRFKYVLRDKKYQSVERVFLPFKANGIQSIIYDIVSIIYSLLVADTLLILGVSGCIILPIIKPFHKKKIIVSVDGLDAKREKWSILAKYIIEASERSAVRYSDIVISDNQLIRDHIIQRYGKISELITYGGDQSKRLDKQPNDLIKYPFLNDEYALSIARIEKENNCELILKSFVQKGKLKIVYIGTWNHTKYARNLFNKYNSCKNIILLESIYDIYDMNLIRSNCNIFIHGNSAGGTNPGLLEAMHVGLPIIAYDVNFNREVTDNNALFFRTKEQLHKNIETYIVDERLKTECSTSVLRIAKKKYMWKDIVQQYSKIF